MQKTAALHAAVLALSTKKKTEGGVKKTDTRAKVNDLALRSMDKMTITYICQIARITIVLEKDNDVANKMCLTFWNILWAYSTT